MVAPLIWVPSRTFSNHFLAVLTRCVAFFHKSSGLFDWTEPSLPTSLQGRCLSTRSMWFKRIEPPRTFSNHSTAETARCAPCFHRRSAWFNCTKRSLASSLQGEQGVQGASLGWFTCFEPSRTFSNHFPAEITRCVAFTCTRPNPQYLVCPSVCLSGETRCAGFLYTSSGWFKRIEPPRTFLNHIITKRATWRVLSHEESFVLMHSFGVVQAHRTSSNLLEPYHHRDSKVWRVLSHEFGVVRLYRTISSYIVTGETRWRRCPMSSGWFECTEPSLSTMLQRKQGLHGAYALVRGDSSTSNLLEPSRTTSAQR